MGTANRSAWIGRNNILLISSLVDGQPTLVASASCTGHVCRSAAHPAGPPAGLFRTPCSLTPPTAEDEGSLHHISAAGAVVRGFRGHDCSEHAVPRPLDVPTLPRERVCGLSPADDAQVPMPCMAPVLCISLSSTPSRRGSTLCLPRRSHTTQRSAPSSHTLACTGPSHASCACIHGHGGTHSLPAAQGPVFPSGVMGGSVPYAHARAGGGPNNSPGTLEAASSSAIPLIPCAPGIHSPTDIKPDPGLPPDAAGGDVPMPTSIGLDTSAPPSCMLS